MLDTRRTDSNPARRAGEGVAFAYEVRVPVEHSYPVLYRAGLLADYGRELAGTLGPRRVCVLSDRRVWRLYGERLVAALAPLAPRERTPAADGEPGSAGSPLLLVPPGEGSKSMATFARLLDRMAELGVDRRSLLVNFGGGVISDLGGFLASAYMRGIEYANLSTSLLGQVDACVGGKVAVNARVAKNLIGAFHHPVHVAGDPELLASLSERDFRCGLAEAIKVAIICGPELFATLEREREAVQARDPRVLVSVIGEASKLKMDLIARDPYEGDLRRPLNLGHTIGHPIETEFGYRRIRHGEAVAIGTAVASAVALRRGMLAADVAERIFALLESYGLLAFPLPIDARRVVGHLRYVRMIRGHRLHFVLPRDVGAVTITDELDGEELVQGFADWQDRARHAPRSPRSNGRPG